MNLPKGLVALPPGIDVGCLFADDRDQPTNLSPQQQRERAFVMWNEAAAVFAPDAEKAALAWLAAALGDEFATAPITTIIDEECRAVKARRHARAAANAAIENGYQP